MIIEVFLLKDKNKKPESVTIELTPESIAEEDSLRNAKILHKNNIMVWWGDTIESGIVNGSLHGKNRSEQSLCFDGLKVNFELPKEYKPKIGIPVLKYEKSGVREKELVRGNVIEAPTDGADTIDEPETPQ